MRPLDFTGPKVQKENTGVKTRPGYSMTADVAFLKPSARLRAANDCRYEKTYIGMQLIIYINILTYAPLTCTKCGSTHMKNIDSKQKGASLRIRTLPTYNAI